MMRTILTTLLILALLPACGTNAPYRCTSRNVEICNLQQRMVRIEDRLQYARENAPVLLSDAELIKELRKRRLAITYPVEQ